MSYYRYRWGGPSYRIYGGFGGIITPAVKKLIVLNVVIFVALFFLRVFTSALVASQIIGFLAVVPQDVASRFYLWQLVTYMFLHGGFGHILINMLVLWMFGCELEREWGRQRFLIYYFLTGIGAGLCNVVVSLLTGRGTAAATIGASGAIYALLLAYGLMFPQRLIYLWFLVPIPAKVFVLLMGAIAFLSSFGASGGISHITHLGGMVFGYIYLRGHRLYAHVRHWRARRLRRKFDLYMRQHEKDSRGAERPPQDRWIH